MPDLDVTVAIVGFECRPLLAECLRRLPAAISPYTFEVVVADNASTDGTVEWLRAEHPDVHVIEMGGNVGFSRANNAAFAVARGRYVAVLNPDTEPDAGALATLVRYADEHPGSGMCAPHLVNTDGTDQRTARSFPTMAAAVFGRRSPLTRLWPRNRWSRRYLRSDAPATGPAAYDVDWVSGACMLVPASTLVTVGGFDERYFMYWEDADWCRRIWNAGLPVTVVPTARVVHHEGGSRRGWPARLVVAFHASAFRYWRSHVATGWRAPMLAPAAAALAVRATLTIGWHALSDVRRRRHATATSAS
jgi:N-acetylglucosaminyl-diphospho-decaprenol L-rhamnosyltransferase